jgi:hypothetical protein
VEALEDAVVEVASTERIDLERPLGLLDSPDPQQLAHEELLRTRGVALERRGRVGPIGTDQRTNRVHCLRGQRAIPFRIAI